MRETSTNKFPKRHDSPDGRFYELNGIYKPSVTTVIGNVITKGKGFEDWLKSKTKDESDKIGKEAMARGTRVHLTAESLINGLPFTITPELIKSHEDEIKMAMGFILWYRENQPKNIQAEKILYHPNHPAAGACDIICQIDGEWHVVDIKTGGHYNTHALQLTAYGWLAKDMLGLPEKPRISVLRLYPWKGKPKYDWRFYDYKDTEWTACNILYRWLGAREPRKLPDYPEVLTLETDVTTKLVMRDDAYMVELGNIFNNVKDKGVPDLKIFLGDGEPTTAVEYNIAGTIYRRNGTVFRKKKSEHEWKELLEERKVPKSSYWKTDKEEVSS